MKNLIYVTVILTFVGCSSPQVAPSQNDALNAISKSNASTKKDGAMQRALDDWLENDWEKNTKGFEETKQTEAVETTRTNNDEDVKENFSEEKRVKKTTSSSNNNESFTLQHYVDKAKYYMEHKKTHTKSHVKELEALPVIGK